MGHDSINSLSLPFYSIPSQKEQLNAGLGGNDCLKVICEQLITGLSGKDCFKVIYGAHTTLQGYWID